MDRAHANSYKSTLAGSDSDWDGVRLAPSQTSESPPSAAGGRVHLMPGASDAAVHFVCRALLLLQPCNVTAFHLAVFINACCVLSFLLQTVLT